jgi:hypothetical protein
LNEGGEETDDDAEGYRDIAVSHGEVSDVLTPAKGT